MLKIVAPAASGTKRVSLGHSITFKFERSSPAVEWKAYLKWNGIYFLKTIRDWSSMDQFDLFPEAPGRYTLALHWRDSAAGREGWLQSLFEVTPTNAGTEPVQVTVRNAKFWIPNETDASRAHAYEQEAMDQLHSAVKPGAVVYDIGANLGHYTVELSRWVGEKGTVYCFEANPVCVSFLQANLQINHCRNCEILPVALTSGVDQVPFTIHYGHTGLGITSESSFYNSKMGHDILSRGSSLDALVETYNLKLPNAIKVDIEGAEGFALKGMEETLARAHPVLLVEIHGKTAAAQTIPLLESVGYGFVETSTRGTFNGSELLSWFPDKVLQIMCHPKQ